MSELVSGPTLTVCLNNNGRAELRPEKYFLSNWMNERTNVYSTDPIVKSLHESFPWRSGFYYSDLPERKGFPRTLAKGIASSAQVSYISKGMSWKKVYWLGVTFPFLLPRIFFCDKASPPLTRQDEIWWPNDLYSNPDPIYYFNFFYLQQYVRPSRTQKIEWHCTFAYDVMCAITRYYDLWRIIGHLLPPALIYQSVTFPHFRPLRVTSERTINNMHGAINYFCHTCILI